MKNYQLLFPHGKLSGTEVMVDYLNDNLRRLKRDLVDGNEAYLNWKINPVANPIALIL